MLQAIILATHLSGCVPLQRGDMVFMQVPLPWLAVVSAYSGHPLNHVAIMVSPTHALEANFPRSVVRRLTCLDLRIVPQWAVVRVRGAHWAWNFERGRVGVPYDFTFNPENPRAAFCSGQVAEILDRMGIRTAFRERTPWGIQTISPGDLFRQLIIIR